MQSNKEIEMKLYDGLKSMLGGKTLDQFKSDNIMSIQKVGPSIAEDITIGAIWAVILSLIAIALYILLRFRDISFSAGTLVSLAFDTVIIISFYSLFYRFIAVLYGDRPVIYCCYLDSDRIFGK